MKYDEDALSTAVLELGIKLVVLFGSRAGGRLPVSAFSDLDLAVLPSPELPLRPFFDYYRPMADIFEGYRLDLVFLHRADPLFRYEIMRLGRLLFGDPLLFLEFRAFAYRDFVDSADLRRLENTLFEKKMSHLRRALDDQA